MADLLGGVASVLLWQGRTTAKSSTVINWNQIIAGALVVTVIATGSAVVTYFLSRKRYRAEVEKLRAEAREKDASIATAEAESEQIRAQIDNIRLEGIEKLGQVASEQVDQTVKFQKAWKKLEGERDRLKRMREELEAREREISKRHEDELSERRAKRRQLDRDNVEGPKGNGNGHTQ